MHYANILTGGIGCGKSTTARLLALHGFKIIDADEIAHKALKTSQDIVVAQFGDSILESNGKEIYINRAKLGNIVFQDSTKKAQLETILHPIIQHDITQACMLLEEKQSPFFVDIPLYFESQYKYPSRFVICVYAPRDTQIKRIQERNHFSIDEAIKRVDSQIDIEIKKLKSDFVIENTKDLKTLQHNIESFLQVLLTHYENT